MHASKRSPKAHGQRTLWSRDIGGATSHAEDGLYCPSRHGESISLLMVEKLRIREPIDLTKLYSLPLSNTTILRMLLRSFGGEAVSLEKFGTCDIGQQE
jgi:hypothetical protein